MRPSFRPVLAFNTPSPLSLIMSSFCYLVAKSCPSLWDPMDCSTPGFPVCLLKFMSIESVMPSNHLILCRPFLLLPSVFPSIRVLCNESALCIKWPKYWSFSIRPPNEYSGLIFFRIDWFDSLCYPLDFQESSSAHNSIHQFFGVQTSLWSNSHICTWLLKKPELWLFGLLSPNWCLCFLICYLGFS